MQNNAFHNDGICEKIGEKDYSSDNGGDNQVTFSQMFHIFISSQVSFP
ncbi:MAG: hypothetical protein M0P12_03065 [Paludibacteraceae bacterium]|nr:hypothetical protein [Paludibacteraceae bacterium]